MDVNDKTLQALAASLNFRQLRQEVISSNVANAETPGYKAKRVDFEEALARALDIHDEQKLLAADRKHFNVGGGGFNNLQPEVYDDPNGEVNDDGNTVNRDQEMAKMAENRIMYEASAELLKRKLALMKYAIGSEK